jgi:hypothetical protein
VSVAHQGLSPFPGDPFTGLNNVRSRRGKIISRGRGTLIQPKFVIQQLQDGEDVAFGDTRHVMDIVGAGYIFGIPYILYVSDHVQSFNAVGGFGGDTVGTGQVDFSFLLQQPDRSMMVAYGPEDGQTAVDLIVVSVK